MGAKHFALPPRRGRFLPAVTVSADFKNHKLTTKTMLPSILADANDKNTGDPILTLFAGLVLIILTFWYFVSDRDKVRRNVGMVIMVATVIFSFLAIASPGNWIKGLSGEEKFGDVSNLRRGIDIAGGASFTLQIEEVAGGEGLSSPKK